MPTTPQDRKQKRTDGFTFEHAGKKHTLAPVGDNVNAGFIRTHRKDPQDMLFSLLEILAGPEELAAIDEMGVDEFNAFCDAFRIHSGFDAGE